MKIEDIESLVEVGEAARVLAQLEERGLKEPVIAAGWTRALLTDTSSPDIDVSYVGPVHYDDAQQYLQEILKRGNIGHAPWDLRVWNAELAYGVKTSKEHLLLFFVDSIDSVYLASDGRLHDPTGFGFSDAKTKTLRINDYDLRTGHAQIPREEANICLEACRRVAQLDWGPTEQSVDRIQSGIEVWKLLSADEKAYFIRKLASKFKPDERRVAKSVYEQFGWGFIFDLL